MKKISKNNLEKIYTKYNHREFVHPDPLEFLYNYSDSEDRETAGIIASSLAYGRVTQILKSVSHVLDILGPSPSGFIRESPARDFSKLFKDFKHRFTTGDELAALLSGIAEIKRSYLSLENCFIEKYRQEDTTILPALTEFTKEIKKASGFDKSSLLPDPSRGSAVKRLNLYLRWMVRKDEVDPSGWDSVSPSKLIVPLDTHMYHFGKHYGFTERKSADIKTAIEITEGFKRLNPEDPVKYDFAITRFGIRNELCWDDLDSICE